MAAFQAGRAAAAGLLMAAVIAGCGSNEGGDFGPLPPTVTRQDVENLPPGDKAEAFTGVYHSAWERLTACHCRAGNCGLIHTVVGEQITVDLQTTGVLSIYGSFPDDVQMKGGANRDGTFWCGAFQEVAPPIRQGYRKVTGTFTPIGGKPTTIQASSDRTITSLIGNPDDLDCDTTMTAEFVGQTP
jgi:hypothetical protein